MPSKISLWLLFTSSKDLSQISLSHSSPEFLTVVNGIPSPAFSFPLSPVSLLKLSYPQNSLWPCLLPQPRYLTPCLEKISNGLERDQAAGPRSSNRLQLFADSLDTCRPLVGAPTANQRLTRGHPRCPHL